MYPWVKVCITNSPKFWKGPYHMRSICHFCGDQVLKEDIVWMYWKPWAMCWSAAVWRLKQQRPKGCRYAVDYAVDYELSYVPKTECKNLQWQRDLGQQNKDYSEAVAYFQSATIWHVEKAIHEWTAPGRSSEHWCGEWPMGHHCLLFNCHLLILWVVLPSETDLFHFALWNTNVLIGEWLFHLES